jgi:integrase
VADLEQDPETGIWFFDISTAGGRSIKTASSRRKVPVHPGLEGIGLLSYRQALLDGGAAAGSSLWPVLGSAPEARPGARWSKWFSRYLRNVTGVKDRSKVFHSFRHTFKRMARDAGISEEMHDALTGHAGGGDGLGRAYGRGFGLEAMARQVRQIAVPEAVERLRWVPAV